VLLQEQFPFLRKAPFCMMLRLISDVVDSCWNLRDANGVASSVPGGTVLHLLLTRQFLPGYFQPPLPGLDRRYRQGIANAAKPPTALRIFSVAGNTFMRWDGF
jgi:hypothetical protein